MKFFSALLKFLILLFSIQHIKSDYYSSVVGLEDLLNVEQQFIESVEKYFNSLEKVNKEIESFLDEITLEREKILQDPAKYYGDPINAFKIIKRFVLDWQHIDDLTNQQTQYEAYTKSITLPADEFSPPTIEDLKGAARGLVRLQKIYKLDTQDISEGYIKDIKYSEDLTAQESFILARSLYESSEYLYASEWFMRAMEQLDDMRDEDEDEEESEKHEFPFVTHVSILEYLGASLYNAGNRKLATVMNHKLLEMDPENQYGKANEKLFIKGLIEERRVRVIDDKPKQKSKVQDLYAKVCSGELKLTPTEQRPLRCRYVNNNVPFYFIGPFKMEELNHEPFVAYYHQTIHDSEIKYIIKQVEDYVERSTIGSANASVVNEIRTSKNSWLWFNEHKYLADIYQRLEDITGLSLVSGEALQVANYGIGGHYGPHYDFSDYPDLEYPGKGNRILTALFYINDVELGGATAFPFLRLAVPPIKHSLVVWHNMHKSLEYDFRTKHAGCPVLKGSKWICNEWFHTVGQEFTRPCGLKPDGQISKHYKNIL